MKIAETISVRLFPGENVEKQAICKDCHKDYRPVSFHRNSRYFSESPKIKNVDEYYFNEEFEEDLDQGV